MEASSPSPTSKVELSSGPWGLSRGEVRELMPKHNQANGASRLEMLSSCL
jgi:hypothetical protein